MIKDFYNIAKRYIISSYYRFKINRLLIRKEEAEDRLFKYIEEINRRMWFNKSHRYLDSKRDKTKKKIEKISEKCGGLVDKLNLLE